jgi:hypothetical protein
MKPAKPEIHPKAMVWRISEGVPMGEWVEKTPPGMKLSDRNLPEVSYGSWVTSSYDLLDGSEATEVPPDTLSGDLFDELFPPVADKPNGTEE